MPSPGYQPGANPFWPDQCVLNGNSAVIFQNASEELTGLRGALQTIVGVRNMFNFRRSLPKLLLPLLPIRISVSRGGGAGTSYTDGQMGNDWSVNTGPPPPSGPMVCRPPIPVHNQLSWIASDRAANRITALKQVRLRAGGSTSNDRCTRSCAIVRL